MRETGGKSPNLRAMEDSWSGDVLTVWLQPAQELILGKLTTVPALTLATFLYLFKISNFWDMCEIVLQVLTTASVVYDS